jgi:hypothetical protein
MFMQLVSSTTTSPIITQVQSIDYASIAIITGFTSFCTTIAAVVAKTVLEHFSMQLKNTVRRAYAFIRHKKYKRLLQQKLI